jgi:hypothetical protein
MRKQGDPRMSVSKTGTIKQKGEIMGKAIDFGSMFENVPNDDRHVGQVKVSADLSVYPESREIVQVGAVLDLDIVRPRFDDYKAEAARIATDAKALTVQDQESLNVAVMIGGHAKKVSKAIDARRKAIILEPAEFVKGVNGICKMITDSLDEAERITKQKIGQHQAKVELERREAERKAKEATEALQRKLQAEADEANQKAAEEARIRVEAEQKIKRETEAAEARERGAKRAELAALEKKAEEERQAALKKAEEDAAKIAVVAPTVVAPVVQEAPRVTRTESGSASQRKNWTFEAKKPEQLKEGEELPREYMTQDDGKIRDAIKMGVREIPTLRIFEATTTVFRA